MKEKILKIVGVIFTLGGLIWFISGEYTNGLLCMIMGELVDLPYRIIK